MSQSYDIKEYMREGRIFSISDRLTKYKPSRDIPAAVREIGNTRPVDIVEWILSRRNTVKSQESITMWFSRHPTIKEDLEEELKAIQLPEKEITRKVFLSGTFVNYPSVALWIREMRRRKLTKITTNVSTLKRVMLGVKPKKNMDLTFHGWVLRHPDRFSLDDALEWIDIALENFPDVDLSGERMVMRSFLMSKGIHVGKKISGAKHKSAGRYAKLFVARDILQLMFDWLMKTNYQAYVCTFFMFKTGTRVTATLNARLENIIIEGTYKAITVIDKGNKTWEKHLSDDLFEAIKLLTGYPEKTTGKIFTFIDDDMSDFNKQAILKFYPELLERHPGYNNWNHFWRHMFAQHMLRKTNWKYGIVAALGGWTVKALEESYGKPPRAIVQEWGEELIPEL